MKTTALGSGAPTEFHRTFPVAPYKIAKGTDTQGKKKKKRQEKTLIANNRMASQIVVNKYNGIVDSSKNE